MARQKTEELPEKPIKPDPSECCNKNCENCVYTYYEKALKRWEENVNRIKNKRS